MIYSIGYGGRQSRELFELLIKYNIKLLVDVRKKPQSKWNIDYNKTRLSRICLNNNIEYIHKPELGGFKAKNEIYYNALNWLESNHKDLAIMCCELHYFYCHRYQKIGNDLAKRGCQIRHITSKGKIYIHPLQFATSNKLSSL